MNLPEWLLALLGIIAVDMLLVSLWMLRSLIWGVLRRLRIRWPISISQEVINPAIDSESRAQLMESDAPIALPGFRFYPSRASLSQHRPIIATLQTAEDVWVFWNTGSQASIADAVKSGRLKKIILPHPMESSLEFLARAVDREKSYLIAEIERLTREALQCSIPVRWFRGFATSTIMIGNPDAVDGWIQIETLMVKTGANDRPSLVIGRKEFPKLFADIKKAYEATWNASELPTGDGIGPIELPHA